MRRFKYFMLLVMCAISMTAMAQKDKPKPLEMELWLSQAPYQTAKNEQDTAKLYVFLPEAKKATGRAIVCCPGGGYSHLALFHEGLDWATYFLNQGIALIVLKYRMPGGNYKIPIADAEEAMKVVRRHAADWNISSSDVGIMGFSAGGHLASTIATHAKGEAKPDFQILFYPVISMEPTYTHKGSLTNFLGHSPKKRLIKDYSNDTQVNRTTPRAFIALSDDDNAVLPVNGANYYMQCYRHEVPASLHIYPTGGHGWGYREGFAFHYQMIFELKAWLESF